MLDARNPSRSPLLERDPLADLAKPVKQDRAKPTLGQPEIKRVLAAYDRDRLSGLRDAAMVMVLLTSGMRRSEVLALRVEDVDLTNKRAHVRLGKGQKFRVVPLGATAIRSLREYLDGRTKLRLNDEEILFVTQTGSHSASTGARASSIASRSGAVSTATRTLGGIPPPSPTSATAGGRSISRRCSATPPWR